MQVDTVAGLSIVFAFGTAAYFDNRSNQVDAHGNPKSRVDESLLMRSVGSAIVGMMGVCLIAASVYFFTQVPTRLWELTAGLVVSSLMLRLFMRMSSHRSL